MATTPVRTSSFTPYGRSSSMMLSTLLVGPVTSIMSELEATSVEDETWHAKFMVMKENLEHHIEEEEKEMFKQARDVFEESELEDLGARMTARKEELQAA